MPLENAPYPSKMIPTQPYRANYKLANPVLNIQPKPDPEPKLDPIAELKIQINKATSGRQIAQITADALQEHRTDLQMSRKVIETVLTASKGLGRGEAMGQMMNMGYANMLLSTHRDLRDLSGHDLGSLSMSAAERLPYNQMNVTNTILPAGLNLSQNAYMNGANLDGVTARNLTVPGTAAVTSAHNAHIDQETANASTFQLSAVGGLTGFQAVAQSHIRGNHVIDVADASTDMAKIGATGASLKNDHTVKPKWAGISDPTPFAAA